MEYILPILVIFFAGFTQSVTGFGSALVAMAFLPELIGIHTSTPLVALIAMTLEFSLLLKYRTALNFNELWRLILSSLVGIPLGIWALKGINEDVLLKALGFLIAGYALYGLLKFKLPRLRHPAWAYSAGFLSGVLSGAYNTGGPPVVIYGDCSNWKPVDYKSNLQGFFLISDLLVVLGHTISKNITFYVIHFYLWTLPALVLGIFVGISLDRFMHPANFRKVVLVLLAVMGVRMIL